MKEGKNLKELVWILVFFLRCSRTTVSNLEMNLASARGGEASRTAACQQVIAGLIPSHSASFRVALTEICFTDSQGVGSYACLWETQDNSAAKRSKSLNMYTWTCPEMGVPPNHPFLDGIFQYKL